MSLTSAQRQKVTDLLRRKIREKLKRYDKRETRSMPFHFRLLGKDRMAVYSFIASINTSIGQSIFEQIAKMIAEAHFLEAATQFDGLNDKISSDAQRVIQDILDNLTTQTTISDKVQETRDILKVAQHGRMIKQKRPKVDLYVKSRDGIEYYFDLKTVKPNSGDFEKFKRTLLEWIAIRGTVDPTAQIKTFLALPYNPNEPEPYDRWTMKGIFDVEHELMVGKEFWDFLGGEETYEDLLAIFENVGIELKQEIEAAFNKFSAI